MLSDPGHGCVVQQLVFSMEAAFDLRRQVVRNAKNLWVEVAEGGP